MKAETDIAYFQKGQQLEAEGKLNEAISAYSQAIKLNPNNPLFYQWMANALTLNNQLEEALAYHRKVSQIRGWDQHALKGYEFTRDFFTNHISNWKKYLNLFAEKPGINALEIGSFQGISSCWLLDNILTHPTARITCVDTFAGSVEHDVMCADGTVQTIEQRFDANVAKTGKAEQVRKMIGASQTVLRSLIPNAYHLAYIDGSHVACDVLEDAVLTWRLVKVGGVIIFDDYGFRFPEGITEQPPQPAIDAFKTIFQHKVKLLHQGYQVLLEKIAE